MTRRVLTVFSALATMAIVALATPPVATQGNGVPALVITAYVSVHGGRSRDIRQAGYDVDAADTAIRRGHPSV
jgi:hypothetical protein